MPIQFTTKERTFLWIECVVVVAVLLIWLKRQIWTVENNNECHEFFFFVQSDFTKLEIRNKKTNVKTEVDRLLHKLIFCFTFFKTQFDISNSLNLEKWECFAQILKTRQKKSFENLIN